AQIGLWVLAPDAVLGQNRNRVVSPSTELAGKLADALLDRALAAGGAELLGAKLAGGNDRNALALALAGDDLHGAPGTSRTLALGNRLTPLDGLLRALGKNSDGTPARSLGPPLDALLHGLGGARHGPARGERDEGV